VCWHKREAGGSPALAAATLPFLPSTSPVDACLREWLAAPILSSLLALGPQQITRRREQSGAPLLLAHSGPVEMLFTCMPCLSIKQPATLLLSHGSCHRIYGWRRSEIVLSSQETANGQRARGLLIAGSAGRQMLSVLRLTISLISRNKTPIRTKGANLSL